MAIRHSAPRSGTLRVLWTVALLGAAGCAERALRPADEQTAGFRWHYSGYSHVVNAQAEGACSDQLVLVGLSGSSAYSSSFRFENAPLSEVFSDPDFQALGERFVTCLVRSPETYAVQSKYAAVRPGLLILSPAGERWGSIPLFPQDPTRSLRDAKHYLHRALASVTPLPADLRQPIPLEQDVPGDFLVATVESGSSGEAAGLKVGDRLVRVNGHDVASYLDVARLLDYFARDREVGCEVERGGQLVALRCPPHSNGVMLDFHPTTPPAAPAAEVASPAAVPAPAVPTEPPPAVPSSAGETPPAAPAAEQQPATQPATQPGAPPPAEPKSEPAPEPNSEPKPESPVVPPETPPKEARAGATRCALEP